MGSSISVFGSYTFQGVPPHVLKDLCLVIEGRKEKLGDVHLLEVKPMRNVTVPVRMGACWHEVRKLKSGHVIELRKVLTHLSEENNSSFHIQLTMDVVKGPRVIPRFHGTCTLTISPTDHGKSSVLNWTNAFVPGNCMAYIPAIFFHRYMIKLLKQEENNASHRLHIAALNVTT